MSTDKEETAGAQAKPSTCEWRHPHITADPYVTEPLSMQGMDRYSYVQNSPINYTDPSGFAIYELEVCVQVATAGPGGPGRRR